MVKHRWTWRAVLALTLLILGAVPVLAQGGGGDPIPTFDAFLQALSGPLVAAAVSIVLSVVVEYWPQYEALDPKWKRLIFFALSLVVPISAAFLRVALGYAPLTFDPLIWHAIWNGFGAAGIGTLAHTRKL